MRRFVISENSMSPALAPGDRFVTRRLRRARRGDVVFFPHPHRDDFWLVKRLVGLAGEEVAIAGGAVAIDGTALHEPWTTDDTFPAGRWLVPSGHIFVLSDARHRSQADSRTLGPIPAHGAYVAALRYRRASPR